MRFEQSFEKSKGGDQEGEVCPGHRVEEGAEAGDIRSHGSSMVGWANYGRFIEC